MKVVIYSGVPGSGKSTLAAKEHPGAPVCSADHFFERDSVYAFNPARLPEAHAACLRKFVELVQAGGWPVIVVDNTNTTAAEVAPYAALALAYDYALEIVTVHCDPDVAAARNTHGVPVHAVRAMATRLAERALPPWWPTRVA